MFSTLFPVAFPALMLAHFVALLSPGQDFFLIVGHSIRYKLCGSRYICLGVALGNAVYITLAIVGWAIIRDNSNVFSMVETIGATYLLWVGVMLLKSRKSEPLLAIQQVTMPSMIKQLLLGLNSALLNPKNALFYMSLMTVILRSEVTLLQQVSSGVWMFLVVLLWNLLIASLIGLPPVQNKLKASIHIIERIAGIVLIFFSAALFIGYLPIAL